MECESDEHSSLGSLVHIRACEGFPKKSPQTDDPSVQPPFPFLSGEYTEHCGRTPDGMIVITNYRLFVQFKHHFYNIPLCLIEQVECREIVYLYIFGKDAKSYRCAFPNNDQCLEWHRRLLAATSGPKKLEDLFAFAYYAWNIEETPANEMIPASLSEPTKSLFLEEVERMGFDLKSSWRISRVNEDYSLCSSYPPEILVPASIEDKVLLKLAIFRSSKRIPAVVWRHRGNGCVIARCSQPEMGWMGWRNYDDEKLIQDIGIACAFNGGTNSVKEDLISTVPCENPATDPKELQLVRSPAPLRTLILDARSYAAAFTNRAKGGGYECQEYYPNCEIQFMSLANIHSIRRSFQSVRSACAIYVEQTNWLSVLENTKWLQHISGLLKASLMVVNAIDREERPVVVHCSDGWDRTSQIVGLAELMLDPYYRTIRGFQVLVEKEWLEFGHKFGDRCGHGLQADDANERCPVFLQWLDCIHQLLNQFPTSFEFNNTCLVKLVQHTYSCLFGTFLCNNSQERKKQQVHKRTHSVWNYIQNNDSRFRNYLYVKNESVLRPSWQVRDLVFWKSVYVQNNDPMTDDNISATGGIVTLDSEDTQEASCSGSRIDEAAEEPPPNGGGAVPTLVKTRSCNDLSNTDHFVGRQRRLSDPHSISDGLKSGIEVLANGHSGGDECVMEPDKKVALTDDKCVSCDNANLEDETTQRICNGARGCEDEDSASDTLDGANDYSSNGLDNRVHVCDYEDEHQIVGINGYRPTKIIETSTDTLVGELAELKPENCLEHNELQALCNGNLIKQEGSVHISTSTTDISDSRVGSSCCSANNCGNNNFLMFQKRLQLKHSSALPNIPNNNCHNHLPPTNSVSLDHPTLNGNYGNINYTQFPKCMVCTNVNGMMSGSKQKRILSIDSNIDAFKQLNCSSTASGGVRSPGSNVITPLHSRTPSSGFPATPSEERPADDYTRHYSSASSSSSSTNTAPTITTPSAALVERKLDVDGLPLVSDEIQQRLHAIIVDHQTKENALKYMLSMAQLAMCQQVCQRCNNHSRGGTEFLDEVGSQPESVGSCGSEHPSIGQDSTAASDLSWETVDEQDTRPTLWEPDHAVNRCPTCDHEFCLMRRKHHCRSCGRIFCSECSNQVIPVPNEQFYDPVRVCSQCFKELRCRQQVSMDYRFPKAIYAAAPGSSN